MPQHPTHSSPAPIEPIPADGYAGDINCQTAYHWWQSGQAVLIDVRSNAELEWVGFVPGAVSVPFRQWPGMTLNLDFDAQLLGAVPPGKKVLMLCRSGLRSIITARRATQLGLQAYNVLEGFEGDPNELHQRNHSGGWRYQGLPWQQS